MRRWRAELSDSSVVRNWVHLHEYRDSMVLMYVSAQLEQMPGVERAMAIMGTDNNKELLATVGLLTAEADPAGPNDLIVAVRAAEETTAAAVDSKLNQLLSKGGLARQSSTSTYASLVGAASAVSGGNLVLISVPGRYAAREARRALDLGLHVFLFSDNVALADEIELKRIGGDRGLLVMGPDCGTALIRGYALGFANSVRRGSIGIVGAAGTGIQEVSSLIDRMGCGVSHALGTGGRDLWAEVGGMTTLQALDLLDADPETSVLVLLSKIPSAKVAERVVARAACCRKPVVACLLGQDPGAFAGSPVHVISTLEQTAAMAVRLAGGHPADVGLTADELYQARAERARLAPGQRFVRGLFSGGSLCEEAMVVWRDSLGPVWSNVPLDRSSALEDPMRSREHTAIDLGDDRFTSGRPHPMIDPGVRKERLLAEADDPETAVIVLDVVIGFGTNPDMAGELVPAIQEARRKAAAAGRSLAVVAHVCGTTGDPQGLNRQEEKLRAAGVLTTGSNVAAARLAALIAAGEQDASHPFAEQEH